MAKYYFLREDIAVLEETANQLQQKIKELGKEQGEAARQSTEIFGHDDACQETVYQDRRVVISRLNNLRDIINSAIIVNPQGPFDSVRLGAKVELSDGRTFRIGSFVVAAEHPTKNISYNSPLARALLSKEEGETVEFLGRAFTIKSIT